MPPFNDIVPSGQFSATGLESFAAQDALTLDLLRLAPLTQITSGRAETRIDLIDGLVATGHPELSATTIHDVSGEIGGTCERATSIACMHGTFVAGICAKRGSAGDKSRQHPGLFVLFRGDLSSKWPNAERHSRRARV